MFTPQRKGWSEFSLTPRIGGASGTALNPTNLGKGKEIALADDPAPPLGSLTQSGNNKMLVDHDIGNMEDWKKFKEAGFLDEGIMENKDREALLERVTNLQRELYDYQYNMGLLLIEKKEWTSRFEDLRQKQLETLEILKREQSGHLIALSEAEKREENLRKALTAEKQCAADLEKALREMRGENAKVKIASETKFAEANALIMGIGERSSLVDKNLDAAEAKLAEVNRKSSELDMKLQELEARESLLQKERLSFVTDQEAYKAAFFKQREDLKEWELKLKEREEMLCLGRKTLNEREEKTNEIEKNLKQKERDLELMETYVHSSSSMLKEKEADIIRKQTDVDVEEQRANSLKIQLEMKEKELLLLEEKLNMRERVELQKVLGEQNDMLDTKLREFEQQMEEKRKSLDDEYGVKLASLERREVEVNHCEEKLGKEEQALSKKAERLKEQHKEIETKLKSIKDLEKAANVKGKEMEKEKQKLEVDRDSLKNLVVEIENMKVEISLKEQQMRAESDKLRITMEERSEYAHLQSELKHELENTRMQKEVLLKEAESLKQEREMFEKEWEALDEKRAEISKRQMEVNAERENLKKLQDSEEERLKREKQAMQDHIHRELQKLELEKESFTATMKHEQLALSEKAENEHEKMLQDFELRRRNLENEIFKRQEEMDKDFQQRRRVFEEEREREKKNVNLLKDAAEKEWEEVQTKKQRLEKEKEEVQMNKKQLKVDQLGICNDIDELVRLSERLKERREEFLAQRNQFAAIVEKLRGCKDCGEIVSGFVRSNLQLPEMEEKDFIISLSPDDTILRSSQRHMVTSDLDHSGSRERVSLLRRCSNFLKFSPSKRTDNVPGSIRTGSSPLSNVKVNIGKAGGKLVNNDAARGIMEETQPSYAHVNLQNQHSENIITEVDDVYAPSVDDHSYMNVPDDSYQSAPKNGRHKVARKQKSGTNRTRSVKAVVEDAKVFLGESQEDPKDVNEESLGDSTHTGKAASDISRMRRQRARTSRITESEQDAHDSDGQADSITTGRRKKRRQTVAPPVQSTGERRYNLRRHKTAGMVAAEQVTSNVKKTSEKAAGDAMDVASNTDAASAPSSAVADENGQATRWVQVTTVKNVDFSDDRAVKSNAALQVDGENADANKSVDCVELSEGGSVIPEYGEDEKGSTVHENEDEYDYEDGDEEDEDPGKVSIGKKIWTFFTS